MKKRNRLFICLIGLDGAGKTTLAQSLVEFLKDESIPVNYAWGSADTVLLKPFMALGKILFLRSKDPFEDYTGYKNAANRTFRSPFMAISYKFARLFEQFYQIQYKVTFPLICGRTVVCDRYAFDTIVGLAVDLQYSQEKFRNTLRRFMRVIPKPDLLFLVDVPEEVAYERKNDIYSLAYLKPRRNFYLSLANDYNVIVLDGCQSKSELQHKVLDTIRKRLKR